MSGSCGRTGVNIELVQEAPSKARTAGEPAGIRSSRSCGFRPAASSAPEMSIGSRGDGARRSTLTE